MLPSAVEDSGLSKARAKRDELTIMSDILELTSSPKSSTKILFGANLSYTQARRYLDLLLEKGFIEMASRRPPAYVRTSKGKLFLKLISG